MSGEVRCEAQDGEEVDGLQVASKQTPAPPGDLGPGVRGTRTMRNTPLLFLTRARNEPSRRFAIMKKARN